MTTLREDIVSDLETVFEDWDDITWNGKTFKGIFHEPFEAVALFGIEIESKNPFIEVKDADIVGMAHEATVTINSMAYKVKSIQPTGFGKSLVELSKD